MIFDLKESKLYDKKVIKQVERVIKKINVINKFLFKKVNIN